MRPVHAAPRLGPAAWSAVLALGLGTGALRAQPSAAPLPCDCAGTFEHTVARIEHDYVAFPLEVRGERVGAWHAHVDSLRSLARTTSRAECAWLLRSLTRFFHDGHLMVLDVPASDSSGLAERRLARPTRAVVAARHRATHPIEGVWRGPGYRIAVQLEPGDSTRAVGIVLDVDSGAWMPGQVRAEFALVGDEWRATIWDEHFLPRTSPVRVSRVALLRMPPLLWGRVDATDPLVALDPHDPRSPTVRYPDDSSAILSITTLDPAYGQALRELVDTEWERLRARAHLVIDLRGNEGGSSTQVVPLLPFLWRDSHPTTVAALPSPREAVARSSPATIAFWQRAGWAPAGLEERLRAAPGALVAFDPTAALAHAPRPARVSREDQRVDVLVDGATVSAAEQVVLWARAMGRARIIGTPTGGSIDYQSAWLSRVSCGAMGVVLSIPLIAAHEGLPARGHNRTGIRPDLMVPTVGDWLLAARSR